MEVKAGEFKLRAILVDDEDIVDIRLWHDDIELTCFHHGEISDLLYALEQVSKYALAQLPDDSKWEV